MFKHRFDADEGGSPAIAAVPSSASAAPRPGRLRRLSRAVIREPLTHFALIGAAIFLVSGRFEERVRRYSIDITSAQVARLVQTYGAQYGEQPTAEQTQALLNSYIKEEVYLREAIALGLDRNDEIVRRRLAQKFEFVQQDRATPAPPTQAQLRTWYEGHLAAYRHPSKRSFDQVYFAMDQRGEAGARQAAGAMLARLQGGGEAPPGSGDLFPGPSNVRSLTQDEIARLFGGDGFAGHLFTAPPDRWSGPYRSGYGWHIVRVTEIAAPRQRSFAEAEADVAADWQAAERTARNDAAYGKLLARYHVSVAGLPQ